MAKNAAMIIRHPGKVDFRFDVPIEETRVVKWRVLESETGTRVHIFGYRGLIAWFGYLKSDLRTAPCSHCGRTGVFGGRIRSHNCSGVSGGVKLPCGGSHDCKAEPSMSWHGIKLWYEPGNVHGFMGWREIE